jgi:hypothetical protein
MNTTGQPIGYCAVIAPKKLFWQGFHIVCNDVLAHNAKEMEKRARDLGLNDGDVSGSLQATLYECATTNNMMGVATAARALWRPEAPCFIVRGSGVFWPVPDEVGADWIEATDLRVITSGTFRARRTQ